VLRILRTFPAAAGLCALSMIIPPTRGALAGALLQWTAPGNDGPTGTAARYDLRRSTQPITTATFASADTVAGVPLPATGGTVQTCAVALPVPGTLYYFALKTVDAAGNWSGVSNTVSAGRTVTAVAGPLVTEIRFDPPWPNPARGAVHLRLQTPGPADGEIGVYDAAGRRVRLLWKDALEAGPSEFTWDLRNDLGQPVARGVFFVRARIGAVSRVHRVLVLS
jgi:hypothetical protein